MVAGLLILQQTLQQSCVVRRGLRQRLQEARQGRMEAEREQTKAVALAATHQHDLELLKQQVVFSLPHTNIDLLSCW